MQRDNYNWGSSKKRYEWKDEYLKQGFAPPDKELEAELFGENTHVHTGLNFDKYESIPVRLKGDNPPKGFDKVRHSNKKSGCKETYSCS